MTVKLKLTILHVLRKTGNVHVDYSLNYIFQKLSLLYCSKENETYGSFFKYITCTMFKYVFAYVCTSYNHMNVSILFCTIYIT